MRRFKRVTAIAATAAGLLAVSAASFAAGGTTYDAAVTAAQSDYRNAVASCNRMDRDEQRRCMRDADAARDAATIKARDMQDDTKSMGLDFLPAAEGATGDDIHERDAPGGGMPTYRKLPDVERLPDNLASNAVR